VKIASWGLDQFSYGKNLIGKLIKG
jgi:hypothetical protein